ncbi:succinate dehydrogenase, cytochrome b556 subunit [Elstera cyanobacteriorum]|uniref:Succinate dehydrogenase cytochrome b556 subunit n=1 Tax=Elstera cyanobacteriorum TaxID=2022747 RepID=A0A255XS58_9PROT|nr:succinate dehydrogenase, cytochrome b556 subunit [Elstera cyanobacteriorum]MCK6441852.1 succinate dehydrogenase, cytochrome b556 subunit [Elstera cyanobacteriorum]OYQ19808.1 succinate dehydrogenase, cytochrome b556 subunit [Elstera cyanobacteriorum]GFZ95741.1 succinate dehydrogenase, cytochrome b556 subunit [Elstera cyanobacteriorum]
MDAKRPLSPHLQIYRLPLTAIMSISHRATGVALSVGTLLLLYWLVSAALGPTAFATAQSVIGSWFGRLLLFGWSVALFYHLSNGLRHLLWDAGYGFTLPEVDRANIAVLGATAVLTLATWIAGLVL